MVTGVFSNLEDAYFVDLDVLGALSTDGSAVGGHIMDESLSDSNSFGLS